MIGAGKSLAPGRIRQRIGPTLRALRLGKGLAVQELAEKAEISASHLSRIERGLAMPSYDVLDRIAIAVGSDLTTLRMQEREARAVDMALNDHLAAWGLSAAARQNMMELSDETRSELAEMFARLQRDQAKQG